MHTADAKDAVSNRAGRVQYTGEEGRKYSCVVHDRGMYTMEEYKYFLLGSMSAVFRAYRSKQTGVEEDVLPVGTSKLLRSLHVYAAHFFSADPHEYTEQRRGVAREALGEFVREVLDHVRGLHGDTWLPHITRTPAGPEVSKDPKFAPAALLPAHGGAGLRHGHQQRRGLHGASCANHEASGCWCQRHLQSSLWHGN